MQHFKTFSTFITSLILFAWLSGCAGTQPVSSPPAEPIEPASEIQTSPPETTLQTPAEIHEEEQIDESLQDFPQTYISEQIESSGPVVIRVNYADIEFVQHRLIIYENKLERWLEIPGMIPTEPLAEEIISLEAVCLQKLESILNGYSQLMERMQQDKAFYYDAVPVAGPKEMQQLDIAFLESRCNEFLVMDFTEDSEPMPSAEPELSFAAAQEIIADLVKQKKYHEALLAYESLSSDFPGRDLSLATLINYGRALQYTGQVEAAARHYKSILVSGDLVIEPLTIQRQIADFLLASADPDAAEFYYNSMILEHQAISAEETWAREQLAFLRSVDPESEDMTAYMKLLREFQTYDYKMHAPRLNDLIDNFTSEHAGSPIAVSALRLRAFAIDQLKSWFGRQLVKIDALVEEKEFSAAADMLKEISGYSLPAELQAVLQRTFYDVAQVEIQEQETQRRIKELELSEQWDAAVNLLDSQQYDIAISAFESFFGTEYEEKAKLKIVEAADQAAGRMRKEAASLFIRAGKTPDLDQKKGLLLESHRLLTEILVKYPQTELLDKVEQNISILEEQIERLDPELLQELHRENSAAGTVEPDDTGARQPQ